MRRLAAAWLAERRARRLGRAGRSCASTSCRVVARRGRPAVSPPAGGVLMALARTWRWRLPGVHGQLVEVEADLSAGLPGMAFTGLADSRSSSRATGSGPRSATPVSGGPIARSPSRCCPPMSARSARASTSRWRWRCSAAPARSGQPSPTRPGSPSRLDGRLRPVRGVLPSVVAASAAGVRRVVVAPRQRRRGGAGRGGRRAAAGDLRRGRRLAARRRPGPATADDPGRRTGLRPGRTSPTSPVRRRPSGRSRSRRPGGHHLTSRRAGRRQDDARRAAPGLLPELDDAAALEVTAVHSVAGLLGAPARFCVAPPLQAPHHTASVAALVGGGTHLARPGAISLAHHGVLFLDEAPEFSPQALDALRQPLESGAVVCTAAAAPCATRPGSSSSWPRIRARAAAGRAIAPARPGPTPLPAAYPGRCSIASTSGSGRSGAARGTVRRTGARDAARWWRGAGCTRPARPRQRGPARGNGLNVSAGLGCCAAPRWRSGAA